MAIKRQLVSQASIQKEHMVLDLGCGTATLTILIKQLHPEAVVYGLDGDQKILELAQSKTTAANLDIQLVKGLVTELQLPNNVFNEVLSSLVFHHLSLEEKKLALREVFRVIKPGGSLHIADWGKPKNWRMRAVFLLVQLLDGFKTTRDCVTGILPELMGKAGFENVQTTTDYNTPLGTLSLYRGCKPE
ncbi:MAG TPA: class I SAM-dependent methyltransferase [Acidobacteriota bacterium]|nr:class I SAM-dependent methyltransferase [Acidobacteriota bacterium]